MSTVSNPSAFSVGGKHFSPGIDRRLAPFVVLAAVIFNFILCFIDTNVFTINASVVISCEIVLIATAFSLICYREIFLYEIFLVLAAYFFTVMLVRFDFDPKILRDLLIPFVFFRMGCYLGSVRWCDRLVTSLIVLTLGAALFEWFALDTYLHYFNVMQYYLARGTEINDAYTANGLFIRGTDTAAGLFINGTRFEQRALLPFLGAHRVSGIFLEPVSVGNFGAIACAWLLLRYRTGVWPLVAKLLAIATVLVLADARLGVYLSIFTLAIYLAAPLIRPTMLLFAPFLMMVALVMYSGVNWQILSDNTIAGRLLGGGESLSSLNLWQILGLQVSKAFSGRFVGDDSGYGYLLVKVGLLGLAAMWALFVYTPPLDKDALRFKNFIAIYAVVLLTISASLFTVKTAALLWFLYGTLNNQNRADPNEPSDSAPLRDRPVPEHGLRNSAPLKLSRDTL
jgi:putative polymerase